MRILTDLIRLRRKTDITGYIYACLCLLSLLACADSSLAAARLQLNKGLVHYARDMEFYYLRPRPEVIPGLILALDREGALERAENRLMVAAFLAELERRGAISIASLDASSPGRYALHTFAWGAHLAGSPDEKKLLERLNSQGENILTGQISRSPSPLARWAPPRERSTLQMFWGAFMATGDPYWLDQLIDAAIGAGGAAIPVSLQSAAAASLYDYAPRHAAIRQRLVQKLQTLTGKQREIIQTILDHAGH